MTRRSGHDGGAHGVVVRWVVARVMVRCGDVVGWWVHRGTGPGGGTVAGTVLDSVAGTVLDSVTGTVTQWLMAGTVTQWLMAGTVTQWLIQWSYTVTQWLIQWSHTVFHTVTQWWLWWPNRDTVVVVVAKQ